MPPPSSAAVSVLISLSTLLSFLTQFVSSLACSPTAEPPCPPFTSPPPYPFSFSAGCGHPSFQLRCSSSAAAISINNLTFSLIRYEPNSTSLTLSPTPPPHRRNCTPATPTATISALHRSISFSPPFRVSDSSCSRLSVLRPCSPQNLPNCTHCSLECKLIKTPTHLIRECGGDSSTRHRGDSQPACQSDVLGFLDTILKLGFEVEWDEDQDDSYFPNCTSCRAQSGFCGFNSTHPDKPFICYPARVRIRPQSPNRIAILLITSLFVCFLMALSIGFVVFHSTKKALSSAAAAEDPTIMFLRRHHRSSAPLPPSFTYDELDSSTNHFDPKRKIGDGGFGSVYLGHLRDSRLVAVKHLHNNHVDKKGLSEKSFCNEILILSSINHPNLVKLHGYCSDPRGLLLVYDYVPNGTLADHLHGKKRAPGPGPNRALSWPTRVDIAFQTALAIEYLHFSVFPPVVHRDVTSCNIFIERDMRVKVGDFGLSRLMGTRNSSGGVCTGPQGTPGYLDPDYYSSFRLNEKSDIYSFGVVLLELITGMRAVDQSRETREMTLVDMVVPRIHMGLLDQVVDPALAEVAEGVGAVAELAFRCVAADKDDRPDAREVAAELRRIKGVDGG